MKSSKFEYRIMTQPYDRFRVEFRGDDTDKWRWLGSCDTFDEAVSFVERNIAKDDFIPQVVEIPNEIE